MCVEDEATEGATQQEDVSGSYQSIQQQLSRANETIATLMQQLKLTSQTTSQLLTVSLSAELNVIKWTDDENVLDGDQMLIVMIFQKKN